MKVRLLVVGVVVIGLVAGWLWHSKKQKDIGGFEIIKIGGWAITGEGLDLSEGQTFKPAYVTSIERPEPYRISGNYFDPNDENEIAIEAECYIEPCYEK